MKENKSDGTDTTTMDKTKKSTTDGEMTSPTIWGLHSHSCPETDNIGRIPRTDYSFWNDAALDKEEKRKKKGIKTWG